MKKLLNYLFIILFISSQAIAQSDRGLKVLITVDMEGLAGVVTGSENSRSGKDYGIFRTIAVNETNAAIEGAFAAGAAEVYVRDFHGGKRNIRPLDLDSRAVLVRGHDTHPRYPVEPVDETFDAVIFIGFHAKAGTPNAIIEHTSTGNVMDFSINGLSLPEAGYCALVAGMYGVPVAFIAGDEAICEQAKDLFGDVETCSLKKGIGASVMGVHPDVACNMIRTGVEEALRNLNRFRPFKLSPPYTMVLKMKNEEKVYNAQFFPGARRTGDWEVTFTSRNMLDIINAFNYMK